MAKKQKQPSIVAELGRPETPAETAARKAENSRLYRSRKTVNNLVFSLLVSLGLMIVIVLMAPGLTGGKNVFEEHTVDVAELAAAAESSAGRPLLAPSTGEGWKAKHAELRTSEGVASWRINYTTPDGAYAGVVQAFTVDGSAVDEAWIAEQLEDRSATGTEQLGGATWTVYDHSYRDAKSANMLFGLQTEIDGSTILVFGTDSPGTLRVLAAEIAETFPQTETAQTTTESGGTT